MDRTAYKAAHEYAKSVGGKSPSYSFKWQRQNAARRGIEWNMTFTEWWDIWLSSGKFGARGLHKGQFVMSRIGDVGPYAVGNVKIITATENVQEYFQRKFGSKAERGRSFQMTNQQIRFLEDSAHPDGRVAYDGYERRTGRALALKGLVSLPSIFGLSTHRVAAAHITDKGRVFLSSRNSTTHNAEHEDQSR